MNAAIIVTFVLGYLAIAFEHPIKINKTATAIITGVVCWSIYALMSGKPGTIVEELSHHLASIAEILFFLLGAMTIVELIDAHQGFRLITDRITSRDSRTLLWTLSL